MIKKKFIGIFFAVFCFAICTIALSVANNNISVANAQETSDESDIEANIASTRELINSIEEDLKQQGTSVVDVLKEQRDDYNSKIFNGTLSDNNNLLAEKVEALNEGIELYEKNNANSEMSVYSSITHYFYPRHVAPNCQCESFSLQPCAQCIVYTDVKMGVLAINAAFNMRGWKLASELMLHNRANTVLDSDYYPENGYRVADATQIHGDLAQDKHIAYSFDHHTPGVFNGVFKNIVDGDAYNALGKFYFIKNDAGNGNVNIDIIDRYDWNWHEDYGIGAALNNTMFLAQGMGIVTPFYTKINITIPGYVPFGWAYNDDGIEITHSVDNKSDVFSYDDKIYDLRQNPIAGDAPSRIYITSIAEEAFKGNSEITSLTIPASVKSIGVYAFANMPNLKTVAFENASMITEIGYSAFSNCPQLSKFNSTTEGKLVVPENIIRLKGDVFEGSAFTDIDFGIKITKIGNSAFAYCRKLQALNIPNNVEEVGFEAFENCTGLKSVNLSESLEILKFNTFRDCTNLESIVLPKLLKEIGSGVFQNCTNLKSIALPESIELIEKMAFQGCTGFAEVCIPRQLNFVNMDVFRGCTGLKKLVFENRGGQSDKKNLKIETGAFADCTGLKNLVIPEFVTSLGNGAFENVNLNKVYYDGSRAAYAKLKANSSANDNFFNADTYFYSANKPFSGTNYWRYDSEGNPEIWPSKQLQGITANGESRAVTTDAIVITFDSDPGENFGVNNVYTNGANVDAVSGSGMTRVVTISEVTVKDGEKLKLELKPAGDYYFANPEIEVAVCVKVCKIFYYEAGKNFFSGDISDCPTEYMEGQTTKLVTPMKFGFEFDGWHLNEDGSGERIYNITPDYRGDITLYAKWKSYDRLPWDSEHIKVMYYTENAETTLDMLFKSDDGLGESSYYIREALFPALAQLNADGYGYELNSTLISAYYPDDDKISATIVLNDGLKFSSDNNLTANDFKAYYDFVVNAYEDLPEPWKYISGFVANDSRALEITLTRPYDIMYVLSELRAVDSELLGEISGMTIEEANACVYAMAADVVTYGRYKIGEISEAGGIFLMPNEKYTFYNENSAYDITLYICGDFQEAGAKYFRGETDAYYNLNEEDILDILGNEELHAYDDRVRMYLGLNKDSTALAQYGEADKQKIIYALGLLIDYDRINTKFGGAEHENNKWFPDGYPFEGMPADDGFDNAWISGINYQSDIVDRQMKARMIFDTLGINPEEFELTLTVKNKRRYTELAAILQSSFEAIGMRLVVNVVATDDETNGGDLLFVFYDFTGKVIADEDFLEKDNLNLIFSPYGYDEEAIIRRLTEKYEEAETETEKQEILGEIQSIMAFYAVKINHINKYYLARTEYFEFTNGHPANLVY